MASHLVDLSSPIASFRDKDNDKDKINTKTQMKSNTKTKNRIVKRPAIYQARLSRFASKTMTKTESNTKTKIKPRTKKDEKVLKASHWVDLSCQIGSVRAAVLSLGKTILKTSSPHKVFPLARTGWN